MSVRSELQQKLKSFADMQNPPIPLALENVPFTKPTTVFIECFISTSSVDNVTTDAKRYRERGVFTVNIWSPSGNGMGYVEALARGVAASFPVIPKQGTVSIEMPALISKAINEVSGFVIIPVTIMYRVEGAL